MKLYRIDKKISIKTQDEDLIALLGQSGVLDNSRQVLCEPGLSAYHMNDGTILEIFSAGSVNPDFLFEKSPVVPSFKVEDIQKTVTLLVAEGVAIPDGIREVPPIYSYCYARFNSGLVIGFFEVK
jgi:hypothetical protein